MSQLEIQPRSGHPFFGKSQVLLKNHSYRQRSKCRTWYFPSPHGMPHVFATHIKARCVPYHHWLENTLALRDSATSCPLFLFLSHPSSCFSAVFLAVQFLPCCTAQVLLSTGFTPTLSPFHHWNDMQSNIWSIVNRLENEHSSKRMGAKETHPSWIFEVADKSKNIPPARLFWSCIQG